MYIYKNIYIYMYVYTCLISNAADYGNVFLLKTSRTRKIPAPPCAVLSGARAAALVCGALVFVCCVRRACVCVLHCCDWRGFCACARRGRRPRLYIYLYYIRRTTKGETHAWCVFIICVNHTAWLTLLVQAQGVTCWYLKRLPTVMKWWRLFSRNGKFTFLFSSASPIRRLTMTIWT